MATRLYRYRVYWTAFHGGHLISSHRTAAGAKRAVARVRKGTDCVCGCAGVIDSARERPGTRADQERYSDPYAIGIA